MRACLSIVLTACAAAAEPPATIVQLPAALGGGSGVTSTAGPNGPARHHGYGAIHTAPNLTGDEPDLVLPPSADISGYAPPPGDQGQTGSCTTWSTAHSALGWWANHDGYTGATFAPMFLYAQIVKGDCSAGSTVETVLGMIQHHGVDTQSDYEPMQFDLDCATQPSSAQQANAARFEITGTKRSNLSGGVQKAIEATIAEGRPAILEINVYPELDNASSSNYLVGPPHDGDALLGGHAITAFAYDENGVWVMNSWGTDWGLGGWAELGWDFVNGSFDGMANVYDVNSITGIALDASDDNSECPLWAFTAQCQDNPSYMLAHCSLSCANPSPTFTTPAEWFHVQNLALGSSYSLDTGVIAATGNYSGQYWELSPLGGGYYRLTNMFQGEAMAFDTTRMAATGNYSGQYWILAPITDGVYRLTNDFLGPGTSLAVDPYTLAVESQPTRDDPTQYWAIFSAD
ncbi:MAG TPA: C1 family peptidase [Kofleriaceae bacterium]|nr:C1 family peptidase [Kofleriaceae bacterium]